MLSETHHNYKISITKRNSKCQSIKAACHLILIRYIWQSSNTMVKYYEGSESRSSGLQDALHDVTRTSPPHTPSLLQHSIFSSRRWTWFSALVWHPLQLPNFQQGTNSHWQSSALESNIDKRKVMRWRHSHSVPYRSTSGVPRRIRSYTISTIATTCGDPQEKRLPTK